MVDFGAFQPRGRYTGQTEGYFRAMMWLSRIEFNLVSRSSRSSTMRPDAGETPREVAVALALVDLAKATNVTNDIAGSMACGPARGQREDVVHGPDLSATSIASRSQRNPPSHAVTGPESDRSRSAASRRADRPGDHRDVRAVAAIQTPRRSHRSSSPR
jgi:hypothetical protein